MGFTLTELGSSSAVHLKFPQIFVSSSSSNSNLLYNMAINATGEASRKSILLKISTKSCIKSLHTSRMFRYDKNTNACNYTTVNHINKELKITRTIFFSMKKIQVVYHRKMTRILQHQHLTYIS